VELAKFLLEKDNNTETPNVDKILEKHSTKEVFLQKKVPVHVEYVISSSNDQGEVIFFGDIYSQEKETLLAMKKVE